MSQNNQGKPNRPETGHPQQGGDKTGQRPFKPSQDQDKKGDKTDNGGRSY